LARDEVSAVLANQLDSLPLLVRETTRVPSATFRGLHFRPCPSSAIPPEVYLEGAISVSPPFRGSTRGRVPCSMPWNAWPAATAPNATASGKTSPLPSPSYATIRPVWVRLSSTTVTLSELTALRDQLKAGLSGKTPEPGSEPPPSVSELAERIKALKAAHNIEAAPQRTRQKQSSAEEPVTARIRRRKEAMLQFDASEPVPVTIPADESTSHAISANQIPVMPYHHTMTSPHPPLKAHTTFRQRLDMERQRSRQEPSLS
jgi:hypothetical protein